LTVIRLEAFPGASVDRAVADVGSATLIRRHDGAFIDVADADAPRAIRALALAGVGADVSVAELVAPSALLPALGIDLGPLARGLVASDIVLARRLTLGEATRELLRRPFGQYGRPALAARETARALLRGEDAFLAWERRAWATRDALRTRAVRKSLRPVVFDRGALERAELRGRSLASSGALTRWLFA